MESAQGLFNNFSKQSLLSGPPGVRTAGPRCEEEGSRCGAPTTSSSGSLFAIVTVFVAITINFFLFRVLPGSAVREPLARARTPRRSCSSRSRHEFGLDKPIWQQYVLYLQQLVPRQHGGLVRQPAAGVGQPREASSRTRSRWSRSARSSRSSIGVVTGFVLGVAARQRGRQGQHEHRDRLLLVPDAVSRHVADLPVRGVPPDAHGTQVNDFLVNPHLVGARTDVAPPHGAARRSPWPSRCTASTR